MNNNHHGLLPSPSISSLSSATSSLSSFSTQKVIDHVQAIYLYYSEKPNSLSFQAGDIIRVLLKLESGWWDGVNPQGQRGWFPSNYTTALAPALAPTQPLPPTPTNPNPLLHSRLSDYASNPQSTLDPNGNNGAQDAMALAGGASFSPAPAAAAAATLLPAFASSATQNHVLSLGAWVTGSPLQKPTDISQLSINLAENIPSGPFIDPAMTDYKYIEVTQDSIRLNPELNTTHWIPHAARSGKLYYYNSALKAYTSSLPFDLTTNKPSGLMSIHENPDDSLVCFLFLSSLFFLILSLFLTFQINLNGLAGKFSSLKTWSEVLDQLLLYENTLQFSLTTQKDNTSVTTTYDLLCSFITHITGLAGIAPGTTPSLASNSQVAKAYRLMVTSVAKLGVAIDMFKERDNLPLEGKTEATNSLVNVAVREVIALTSQTKTFISTYCQFAGIVGNPLDPSTLKDSEGKPTDLIPANPQNVLTLESFDATIPIDSEMVTVLDNQRTMVASILRQIFSLLEMKASSAVSSGNLNPDQFHNDRQQLFFSSVISLVSLVTNMSNLIESVDLSIFQNRSKTAETVSSLNSLFLLFDFLKLKQSLYDNLGAIMTAVQNNTFGNQHFMEILADAIKAIKISDQQSDSANNELKEEEIIKKCATELGSIIDSIVQHASALAQERLEILDLCGMSSTNSMDSVSSGSVSRRQTRINRTLSASSLATSTLSGNKEDVPYYLQLEYGHELVYDAKNHLRGGTLKALVERLTQHNTIHPTFNTAMLLTYQSFTTPQELFQELVARYNMRSPEGLTTEELAVWTDKKQKLVCLRVSNILRKWLDEFWYEDCSSKAIKILLSSMLAFAECLERDNSPGHEKITSLIEDMLTSQDGSVYGRRKLMMQNSQAPPPHSILPRNLKKMKIMDVDPLELARQLTVREFKIYEKIKPIECLNRRQRKAVVSRNSPTSAEEKRYIDMFIHNSTELTNWVGSVILKYADVKKRANAIKYFVTVAEHCRQCNNFSSMMAIISALYSATIHRMKRTWAAINSRTHDTLDNMNKIMNSTRNFRDYRDVLRSVTPPAIPFFGVYLSDLTLVEDGNPDNLQDNAKIINFSKRLKSAEIIRDIVQYQLHGYNYTAVPAVQVLLDQGFAKAPPLDAQYETSLSLEPRERANERMARLLAETGYL